MKIGVPREIKRHEYRVSMTPDCVRTYIKHGHSVVIERGAGEGAGYSDAEYADAGGCVERDRRKIFKNAEMIVKVKEPLPEEFKLLREGQILFTYLHLAADKHLTEALLERRIIGIAYETIQPDDGSLPCLRPMSEIAGRQAVQEAAKYLEKPFGGRGVLLGGVPGVRRGNVTILGGGIVGMNAAKIAVGMGALVTILDISQPRLAYIDDIFGNRIQPLTSNAGNIRACLRDCDVLIGAVLLPGAAAPHLVSREDLSLMRKGAVIVDVAIDQGGCVATSRPTTHDDPVYKVDGITHYCVANMPGAVALTSTVALTDQTRPYGLMIADMGVLRAVVASNALRRGVNLYRGDLTNKPVADSIGIAHRELSV